MHEYEPWEITNQPDRANIERIVKELEQLREGAFGLVPGDALDAIMGVLVRAEVAERKVEELRSGVRQARSSKEEISYVCRICGASVVRTLVVGAFRPSVCGAEQCRREARQEDARARQRRFRERTVVRKGGKNG